MQRRMAGSAIKIDFILSRYAVGFSRVTDEIRYGGQSASTPVTSQYEDSLLGVIYLFYGGTLTSALTARRPAHRSG